MQSPSLFVTTLSVSHKRQILRQVTFIPANENISLQTRLIHEMYTKRIRQHHSARPRTGR
ncbi:hypothetical protein D8W73_15485 [Citrobacter amalonaticus]|nr:hypothetical protein [Citrobacter amalonaticus]EGT4255457.1 hypothetical protein [Citrobacter amalonaticus]